MPASSMFHGARISIHTALAGCDKSGAWIPAQLCYFNPHSPLRLWHLAPLYMMQLYNFNPHNPRRLWPYREKISELHRLFQSTQPSQAVTPFLIDKWHKILISIHTALAGCDCKRYFGNRGWGISIHTALAGCDAAWSVIIVERTYFNPHSPRRLWRTKGCWRGFGDNFNPHSPRRLWRYVPTKDKKCMIFQSTQPSQAVTVKNPPLWNQTSISIHTALAGCNTFCLVPSARTKTFQSTQPSLAVTIVIYQLWYGSYISIHTALAGCDWMHQRKHPEL